MEVATGEYGEALNALVMAVSGDKSTTDQNLAQDQEYNTQTQGVVTTVAKAATEATTATTVNDATCNTNTSSMKLATIAKQLSTDELSSLKISKEETVINVANHDDAMGINKILSNTTCTTSLLESSESVITLPNKGGFPTSGYRQFWILLKRAFLTIIRDKQLTQMRLVSHIVVGSIIGMIYYDIGNEASKVMSNAGCIFFTTLFTMFTAMMPTILTCEHN